jgi:hypothetical protein
MDKEFSSFIHSFVKQYKKGVFDDMSKCKSLLLDHAKGEYKNEIRLLMQSLELGCYATIMNSNDLNITRMSLIKQLQEENYISENIAISLIDLLLLELRDFKEKKKKQSNTVKENIVNPEHQEDKDFIERRDKINNLMETLLVPMFSGLVESCKREGVECYYFRTNKPDFGVDNIYFGIGEGDALKVFSFLFRFDKEGWKDSNGIVTNKPAQLVYDLGVEYYDIEDIDSMNILSKLLAFIEANSFLQMNNFNTIIDKTVNAIRENPLVKANRENNKKSSIEIFNDKAKSVYEPAFKEYQEFMNKSGFRCKFITQPIYSGICVVSFDFSFVSDYISDCYPYYCISNNCKNNNEYFHTYFCFNDSEDFDEFDPWLDSETESINANKDYKIEELTKEVILNELTFFTKKIMSEIRERKKHNKRII